MMDPDWDLKHWQKMVLTVDSPVTKSKEINHRGLKSIILTSFEMRKGGPSYMREATFKASTKGKEEHNESGHISE